MIPFVNPMMLGGAKKLKSEDVFSTTLYTGTDRLQTIETGNKPDLLWLKYRRGNSSTTAHALFDTARGDNRYLSSNSQNGESTGAQVALLDRGFQISGSNWNAGSNDYVAWAFTQANGFFARRVVSHVTGSPTVVSFPGFGSIGMAILKRIAASGFWVVAHQSLPGKILNLQANAPAQSGDVGLAISGEGEVTISAGTSSGDLIIYVFAQNPDLIDCGEYSTSNNTASIQCGTGWKPRFLINKFHGPSNFNGNWSMIDTARGWGPGNDPILDANTTSGENIGVNRGEPTSTGFIVAGLAYSYVYLAIRGLD